MCFTPLTKRISLNSPGEIFVYQGCFCLIKLLIMKIQYKKIKTGEFPGLDLKTPYLIIGQGSPQVSILAGVHGGEESGLLIIKSLLDVLQKEKIKGTIKIIPSCNVIAQAFKTRVVNGFDYADLNRSFPGKKQGSYTQQTAAKIFSLVKDSDCVLDLHTFTMISPLVGILTKSADEKKDERALKILQAMDLDLIWLLETKVSGSSYAGTLGDAFAALKGIYLCLETPNIYRLSVEELSRSVKGIVNLLEQCGVIKNSPVKKNSNSIPLVRRVDQKSENGGLFMPQVRPMSKVKRGDLIGKIYSLKDFKARRVTAEDSGLVMMIRGKSLVSTGDKIIAYGKSV